MELSHDVYLFIFFRSRTVRITLLRYTRSGKRNRMIHYTCDRCKRQIATSQTRYVVQIEIQTAQEESLCEFEDDVDQLTELHQVLEGMSDEDLEIASEETSQLGNYDLCPDCHEQFMRNPLGRDKIMALGFSNN